MKKLKTVDADTLLYQPLDKPSFVVDGLIPTGLTLFCGAQKIGKSWLMLKLCLCVSEGRPLWALPSGAEKRHERVLQPGQFPQNPFVHTGQGKGGAVPSLF